MAYNETSKVTLGDLKVAMTRVKTEIDNVVDMLADLNTYTPAGSTSFENLPTAGAANLGYIYNITNSFTTTADFVEGTGKTYPAGTNVAIIKDGEAYKYDVFVGATEVATSEDVNTMLDEVFGAST